MARGDGTLAFFRLAGRLATLFTMWSVLVLPEVARAAESTVFENPAVAAQLISGEDGIAPSSGSVSVGLVLEYGKGWKGYWRTPGEVGLAPEIDWSGSTNFASADILWPAPERFEAFGIENFGYSGKVVLPIGVTLETAGEPLRLQARVSLLTCSDICVPHAFDLALDLPSGTGIDQASARAIATFAKRVPASADASDIAITTVALDPRSSALFVTAKSDRPFQAVDVFPEFGPLVTFGKPDIRLRRDRLAFWARIPVNAWSDDHPPPRVTVTDTGRAVTVAVDPGRDIPEPPYESAAFGSGPLQLAAIVAIALLGGLILFVMPSVLPVLSIRRGQVQEPASKPRAVIRYFFLFLALALALVWLGLLVSSSKN